jgi:iron(III) transport system substrate-binding protein
MPGRNSIDRRACLGLTLTAFAGALGGARPAKSQSLDQIASYKASDRQSLLEKIASKEGSLLVYTVGSEIDPIIKAFNTKYPFISVRTLKQDTTQTVQHVVQEYQAGVFNVDAFELDDYGLEPLLQQNLLASFWSPEMANYPPAAVERDGRWAMMRQDFAGLGFNTTAISDKDAPRVYADLLAAKWKGRMALAARPSSVTLWVGALALSEGENFVRQLGQQNVRPYELGGAAVDGLVASGEAPMVLDSRRSHIFTSRMSGAKVKWRALGPCYAAVSGVALAARAPHPACAMLFIDFALSKPAQDIYAEKLGYASMRKDVAVSGVPAQKLYLGQRPDFFSDYEKWSDLADATFLNGR